MEWLKRPIFRGGPITSTSFQLSGGAEMRPRLWQQQLIQLLRRRLDPASTAGRDVLVHV